MKRQPTQYELLIAGEVFNLHGQSSVDQDRAQAERERLEKLREEAEKQQRHLPTYCKFCGQSVDLDDEGVQYRDYTCAHEACHDGNEFTEANAPDID